MRYGCKLHIYSFTFWSRKRCPLRFITASVLGSLFSSIPPESTHTILHSLVIAREAFGGRCSSLLSSVILTATLQHSHYHFHLMERKTEDQRDHGCTCRLIPGAAASMWIHVCTTQNRAGCYTTADPLGANLKAQLCSKSNKIKPTKLPLTETKHWRTLVYIPLCGPWAKPDPDRFCLAQQQTDWEGGCALHQLLG